MGSRTKNTEGQNRGYLRQTIAAGSHKMHEKRDNEAAKALGFEVHRYLFISSLLLLYDDTTSQPRMYVKHNQLLNDMPLYVSLLKMCTILNYF